jgi:hypothetical protein
MVGRELTHGYKYMELTAPLNPFLASTVRPDYQRRLEMNMQDSEEDILFWQEMRYPERGA